jgi:hypothetical protein
MGRVKEQLPAFQNGNHFGVLDHTGAIKVAKTEIKQTILHINKDKNGKIIDVLVKGNKGSYPAKIHQGIRNMMLFVDVGDCAFIKWKTGQAWFVGFQKKKAYKQEKIQDKYILENGDMDWDAFFRGVDVE